MGTSHRDSFHFKFRLPSVFSRTVLTPEVAEEPYYGRAYNPRKNYRYLRAIYFHDLDLQARRKEHLLRTLTKTNNATYYTDRQTL